MPNDQREMTKGGWWRMGAIAISEEGRETSKEAKEKRKRKVESRGGDEYLCVDTLRMSLHCSGQVQYLTKV